MKRLILPLLLFLLLPTTSLAEEYVVAENDVLFVSVWGEEALSVTAKVRPDGKITIPGLRDVQAAGLTPMALTDVLEERLATMVQNPILTVTVQEIAPRRLYVFGEGVETAGPLSLPPQSSLLQGLASLSNTKSADFSRAYLMRAGTIIKENLHGLYVDGDVTQDILLQGNDFLFIPRLKDPNVYVLGAVNDPRFIPHRQGLTLLEAVLEAGGFSPMARENRTSVVRKQQDDEDLVIPVRGKDLLQGDTTQNIELLPGDYVIVREGLF